MVKRWYMIVDGLWYQHHIGLIQYVYSISLLYMVYINKFIIYGIWIILISVLDMVYIAVPPS